MPDDVLLSKLAVEKMIAAAKSGVPSDVLPPAVLAATNLAIVLGEFNRTLKKQRVETALRHKLMLALQQNIMNGEN